MTEELMVNVKRTLVLSFVVAAGLLALAGVARAQTPPDTTAYTVAYVEALPTARAGMVAALKRYRDAAMAESGVVRVDVVEQVGRAGHFALVEAWRDQAAVAAHAMAAQTRQFRDSLQPIRVSGYDERPYKALAVVSPSPAGNAKAIHVVTHVDIGGGAAAVADALDVLNRLAEASRKERGNVRFDVLRHATRQNHFTIHEVWENQAVLDAHAAAAHTRDYRDRVQPWSGSPVDERTYRVVR